MGYRTFAAGEKPTAAQMQDYLMDQVVIVCTSTTRPSSPVEGMTIYETDTDKLLIYTTATTTWKAPWNLPWGYIDQAGNSGDQTGIGTSFTDVTGCSVTFTKVAYRVYMVIGSLTVYNSGGGVTTAHSHFSDSGGTPITNDSQASLPATYLGVLAPPTAFLYSTSTASYTVKMRAKIEAGTMTAKSGANLVVMDIGPNGAPA